MGKMLLNRPPIIGGVLWGVCFLYFPHKMPLEKVICKTKIRILRFARAEIRNQWKSMKITFGLKVGFYFEKRHLVF